jgi:hypothetical protein
MKISIKLVTVLCALALGSTATFAQQKMAWEGQKMLFILPDGEFKTTANDEKTFSVENEKQFFKAEILREAEVVMKDPAGTIFKAVEMSKLELVNKGAEFKAENSVKGYYMVAKGERGLVAFCLIMMEKQKFPLMVSFPVEKEESKEEIMKMMMNIYSM